MIEGVDHAPTVGGSGGERAKMKMRIHADTEHVEQMQRAIDEAQKGARVRLIEAADVLQAVVEIERRLFGDLRLTKKSCKGIDVDFDTHAQRFPNAYHGKPESTRFTLEFNGRAWLLTSVGRAECKPGRYWIKAWPEDAVNGLINNNRMWG